MKKINIAEPEQVIFMNLNQFSSSVYSFRKLETSGALAIVWTLFHIQKYDFEKY